MRVQTLSCLQNVQVFLHDDDENNNDNANNAKTIAIPRVFSEQQQPSYKWTF